MKIGKDTNSPQKAARRESSTFVYRTIVTSNETGTNGDGAMAGDETTGRNEIMTTSTNPSENEDEEGGDEQILDVD